MQKVFIPCEVISYRYLLSPGNNLPTASASFCLLNPRSRRVGSRLFRPALAIFSNNIANFLGFTEE